MAKLNTSGFFLLSFTNETNTHYQGWQNICVYTELITTSDMESNNVLSKKKHIFIYLQKIFS